MPARPRSWRAPSLVAALALVVSLLGVPAVSAADEPASTSAASVTHEVTVVRVAPGGGGTTTATTLEDFVGTINGPVRDFWAEETDGAVQISATGWPDWVSTTAGCTNRLTLLQEVADAVGFEPGPARHLLLYLSDSATATPRCTQRFLWLPPGSTDGGMTFTKAAGTEQLSNLLGASIGLGHIGVLSCEGAPFGTTCYGTGRADPYDVMGDYSTGPAGSLSAPGAATLGALGGSSVVTFGPTGRGGRVTLSPISGRTGIRGIRLVHAVHGQVWVEFRPALGRDAWLADPAVNTAGWEAGVLVREQGGSDVPIRAWRLLDGSPTPGSGRTADTAYALPPGSTLPVLYGGYLVRLEAQTSSTATVSVVALTDPFPRDLSADGVADVLAVDALGTATAWYGRTGGGLGFGQQLSTGWRSRDLLTWVGDWDGDRARDVVARNTATGDLWLYPGDGVAGLRSPRVIGRGWQAFDALLSPGDWDSDGFADLLARRRSDGALLLYPGNGRGGFLPSRQVGSGWGALSALATCPDWDVDGRVDFVARRRDGALLQYESDGAGGFGPTRQVGSGWQVFTAVAGVGGWGSSNGDVYDYCTLVARKSDGTLWLYRATGAGWLSPVRVGTGWNGMRLFA